MKSEWNIGDPPRDGRKYEMVSVPDFIRGSSTGWWDENRQGYFDADQFCGGIRRLVPAPNRWRELPTATQQNAAPLEDIKIVPLDIIPEGTVILSPPFDGDLDSWFKKLIVIDNVGGGKCIARGNQR